MGYHNIMGILMGLYGGITGIEASASSLSHRPWQNMRKSLGAIMPKRVGKCCKCLKAETSLASWCSLLCSFNNDSRLSKTWFHNSCWLLPHRASFSGCYPNACCIKSLLKGVPEHLQRIVGVFLLWGPLWHKTMVDSSMFRSLNRFLTLWVGLSGVRGTDSRGFFLPRFQIFFSGILLYCRKHHQNFSRRNMLSPQRILEKIPKLRTPDLRLI